ncbi:MAG: PAS domain S-box protein, partial [Pseudomonadota bacterium]
IMIVEDSALWRVALADALKAAGYQVETIKDGLAAIRKLQTNPPHAVIMDFLLPKVDGGRIVEYIKNQPRLAALPTIILSANVDDTVAGGRLAKADAIIAKGPLDDTLRRCLVVLDDLLRRQQPEQYRKRVLTKEGHVFRSATLKTLGLKEYIDALLGSMAEAVFEVDADKRVVAANPVAERLLGAAQEELLGKNVLELLRVAPAGPLAGAIEAALGESAAPAGIIEHSLNERVFESTVSRFRPAKDVVEAVIVARDITDSRRVKAKLKLFHDLINRSNDIIFVVDPPTGRILYANEKASEALGFTLAEFAAIRFHDVMECETQFSWDEQAAEIREAGSLVKERDFKRVDGATLPVEAAIKHVVLDEKEYFVAVCRDITERKQAEADLRQSEERLRLVINNTMDIFYTAEADGTISYISPQAKDYLGDPENVVGRNFAEFIHPDDLQHVAADFMETIATGREFPTYFRIIKPNGEVAHVEELGRAVREGGQIVRIVGAIRDVTDRKCALDALEHRLHVEHLVGSLANDFINVPAGGLDAVFEQALAKLGEFAKADHAYLYLLDESKASFNVAYLWSAAGAQPYPEAKTFALDKYPWLARQLRANEVVVAAGFDELEPQAQAEKARLAKLNCKPLLTLAPLLSGADLLGFAGLHFFDSEHSRMRQDIESLKTIGTVFASALTHRRTEQEKANLEEQLLQAQKMEAIGRLAGGVAHDMNNALAAVMGFAAAIKAELPAGDPLAEDVEGILTACSRGHDLTRNLLGFARKGKYHREKINLNEVAREIEALLKRTISKKIAVHADLGEHLAYLEGDRGQLSHALMNVCINAAEAITGTGTLSISTANVLLGEADVACLPRLKPGEFVRLVVRDTGTGMDEETLTRVFEPFFTTKPPGKGTGLGLPMVYGTVENHGGAMTIASKPGAGSAVTIYLPALNGMQPSNRHTSSA